MPNERDRRIWAARDSKLERQGLADWERKELRSQLEPDDPLSDLLSELGGNDKAAAVLRQFMLVCLPPKSYGDSRRFKSGFYRMVAFAWRLAPELLDGCDDDKSVADRLGISAVAFFKHLEAVDRILSRGSRVSVPSCKPSVKIPEMGRGRVLPRPGRQ